MKPHHLRKLSLYCFRVMNNNMYHQSVRCQIICSFSSDYKSIITSIIHFSINERLINRTKQVLIRFEVITIQIQLLSLTLSQTHTHKPTHTIYLSHTHSFKYTSYLLYSFVSTLVHTHKRTHTRTHSVTKNHY